MQTYLFPEIREEELRTLVIIGNGFDVAHGIKSKYSDFRKWLISTKNRTLVDMIDIFFSTTRDAWSSIEEAFGEYDKDHILGYCRPDEEFDYDHSFSSSARIEDSPSSVFIPVMAEFRNSYEQWVDSIDIMQAVPYIQLSNNYKYLTFNYTDTLETIYHIPSQNIIHIHGNRIIHDKYIIGHNNKREKYEAWDEEYAFYESNALEYIITEMNEYVKGYDENINRYNQFFDGLSNITKVIVYGHSLGVIDWPYFEKIISHIGNNVSWSISRFSPNDDENISRFVSHFHLSNVTLFDFPQEDK